jgi:transcriptional regulator with XRE-family HTH domain
MEKYENTPIRETTADVIVHELSDEKDGQEFAREYLKVDFLATAVDALFYARHQAGLTQEQVAQKLGKKQEAIARWEADIDGKMSLQQYVEIALACDMIPLEMVLAPVDAVRRYIIENPGAPCTQVAYDAWQKKKSEPATLAQPINMAMSNQEANQEGRKEQRKRVKPMATTDRRAGPHQGPYVISRKLPRSRDADGTWRKKRSDTGKKRSIATTKKRGK